MPVTTSTPNSRAWPLGICFGVLIALVVGVLAGRANPDAFVLTAVIAGAVALVPGSILGRAALGVMIPDPDAEQSPRDKTQAVELAYRRRVAATAAAWRDTLMAVGLVLMVVAFFGYQWPTSYVLLGVVGLGIVIQFVRVSIANR